jgi:hypothetical protein
VADFTVMHLPRDLTTISSPNQSKEVERIRVHCKEDKCSMVDCTRLEGDPDHAQACRVSTPLFPHRQFRSMIPIILWDSNPSSYFCPNFKIIITGCILEFNIIIKCWTWDLQKWSNFLYVQ